MLTEDETKILHTDENRSFNSKLELEITKQKLIDYYESWLSPCMHKPENKMEKLWYNEKCSLGDIVLNFVNNFDQIFEIMHYSGEGFIDKTIDNKLNEIENLKKLKDKDDKDDYDDYDDYDF